MYKRSNKTDHVMRLIEKEPIKVKRRKYNDRQEAVIDALVENEPDIISNHGKYPQTMDKLDQTGIIPDGIAINKHNEDNMAEVIEFSDKIDIKGIPDGIPFEKRDEDIMSDVLGYSYKSGKRQETLEDLRNSIRRDEIKRAEKIEHIDKLLEYGHQVLNLSEVFTMSTMPSIIDRLGVCKCPVCASNILALALNMLPPRYVTTTVGKQYMKLQAYKSQHELDVTQAITKACLKVMSSPRHTAKED